MNIHHGEWYKRADGMRHCSYCGSLHPDDARALLEKGARAEWADRKYGWPHKVYLDAPKLVPEGLPMWGKFYSEHLQDASPETRDYLEKKIGLRFRFTNGGASVAWEPV